VIRLRAAVLPFVPNLFSHFRRWICFSNSAAARSTASRPFAAEFTALASSRCGAILLQLNSSRVVFPFDGLLFALLAGDGWIFNKHQRRAKPRWSGKASRFMNRFPRFPGGARSPCLRE